VQRLEIPFSHSYWVIPGKFLAGFYPGAENSEEADDKLRSLLNSGIRCIIDLMEENEVNYLGLPFISYQPALEKIAPVTCLRFPIRDFSIPSTDQMIRILDSIDEVMESGQAVYVHCLGGIGRTGTVVGCYLQRHGLADAENVFEKIEELRSQTPGLYIRSPETEEQRRFVVEWSLADESNRAQKH
jgi:protein tyrosine/serine phosphatase